MNNLSDRKLFLPNVGPYIFKLSPADVSKKNEYIETLRGVAITLVVIGHMIGIEKTAGMRVSDDSIYRYLYYSLEYIRLPLFTVISGWVYANKPILALNASRFIKGKFRRLIIPMLMIGTMLFLFRMVIPGTNTQPELSELPRNVLFPYDVYWYLFSLFLIFLVISVLDRTAFFHKIDGWVVTILCAFAFLFISENFLDPIPNIFSFKGAAYLFPFFLLGIGIFRYKEFLLNDKGTFLILLVFVASVIIQQMVWFGPFPIQEKHSALGMTVGISAVLLLFRLKFKNNLLIWVGNYAYGIFLLHVFFTGGSRIVLSELGLHNQAIILFLGVIIAILGSILLETIMKRFTFLRLYFLGLRKNKKGIYGTFANSP